MSTPNQDCPLMEARFPVIGLDVWEHASAISSIKTGARSISATGGINGESGSGGTPI